MLKRLLPVVMSVSGVVCLVMLLPPDAAAVDIVRDPMCSGGACEVDNFDLFGAPVGTPLEVDVTFTDMQHISLSASPSTNIEFGIGNTGNNVDLPYRIVFDLSDMNGNLITNEQLVVDDTAPAGTIHVVSLPLTPLPADTIFHDFHIRVDTQCAVGAVCNTFDLRVAGGGGDIGTAVSGPIRFNRAVKGSWVPEPSASVLLAVGLVAIGLGAGRRG
jgi:hypothetical protein